MSTEHMRVLYKDVGGFYKGKIVSGFNIPEVRVCYKEPNYHVVKDICVDEGHPPHQKTAPSEPSHPRKNLEQENKASTGNSLYFLLQSEMSGSDNDEMGERNGIEGMSLVAEAVAGGKGGSPGRGCTRAGEVDGFSEGGRGGADECGDTNLSISGAITFSSPVVCAGNLSIRSDSSTTSTRSFTFPVLQQEWNSSPVRMGGAERSHLVKHRWWRQSLLCCRF